MIPEQKQLELERYRDIISATLDYLLAAQRGCIVLDGKDIVSDCYEQQKIQIAKYFKQRRLDRLKQKLASFTRSLQSSADMNYAGYIKESTGYDIDIFADLRKRVDAIIAQNEIRDRKELHDVGTILHFYYKTSPESAKFDQLRKLILAYSEQSTAAISRKRKSGYSEVISKVEKDGVEEVTIRFSSGPKPKHLQEQEAVSPDGKRRVRVTQRSNGKWAATSVEVIFPSANGLVYNTEDIQDVKAFWKDNSTIVIEIKKELKATTQLREIRSFDDAVTIEYRES